MEKERYLGDAVYASFDGFQIWLKTSDGLQYTNEIALEPGVWESLMEYHRDLVEFLKKEAQDDDSVP